MRSDLPGHDLTPPDKTTGDSGSGGGPGTRKEGASGAAVDHVESTSPPEANLSETPEASLTEDFGEIRVYIERSPGDGEDARPLALQSSAGSGVVSVFDGLGGAGSTSYWIQGKRRTGAFIAARLARSIVKEGCATVLTGSRGDTPARVNRTGSSGDGGEFELSRVLAERLTRGFASVAADLEGDKKTSIRSQLLRRLPTTIAGVYFRPTGVRDEVELRSFWAGDSRAYLMSPSEGLQQLTVDDVAGDVSALSSLTTDAPLTNVVTADGEVLLRESVQVVRDESLVVVATDGCFAYWSTPWHFEHALLDAICNSGTADECSAALGAAIEAVAGDDASLCIAPVTAWQYRDFARAFRPRLEQLCHKFLDPIATVDDQIRSSVEATEALRVRRATTVGRLWASYAPLYEMRLPER